ncbi:MAG: DHH family phosphoesterase [Sphaerochaetaceae bacterium]|nr:DHH family phosphoesterase [Sphaerochaetaceae bacterium]
MRNALRTHMEQAIDALIQAPGRSITLIHHNDTDGLSSGTILMTAFEASGYQVDRFSLEKPYPEVLEQVFRQSGAIIVFADFAGRIAPLISRLNDRRNLVIILDHHPAVDVSEDDTVFNLDPELFGIKGDRDISASATCFLFSELLRERQELSQLPQLVHLGVLGAIGDGFLVDGRLSGVNRELLLIASEKGLIEIRQVQDGEAYSIRLGTSFYPAHAICEALDTVGGVGYYSDGTEKGIEICLTGLNEEMAGYVQDLIRFKDSLFNEEIKRLKDHINSTSHIQWFDVGSRFYPMGIKMIGVFCTLIKEEAFLDQSKYLAGFQRIPETIGGFESIRFDATKISMRASEYLTQKIRRKEIPGLDTFLPLATEHLGGFSDACHSISAATVIKPGQETSLIQEMEHILTKGETHADR